jgi:hypothetical protein
VKAWAKSLAPRDLRAFIALIASIGGTMALTIIACGITWILWRGGWGKGTEIARIDKIGLIAVLVIVIMGVTMTSLGLAINKRSVRGSAFGASFEATGGDESAPAAAQAVAEVAKDKADAITEAAKP